MEVSVLKASSALVLLDCVRNCVRSTGHCSSNRLCHGLLAGDWIGTFGTSRKNRCDRLPDCVPASPTPANTTSPELLAVSAIIFVVRSLFHSHPHAVRNSNPICKINHTDIMKPDNANNIWITTFTDITSPLIFLSLSRDLFRIRDILRSMFYGHTRDSAMVQCVSWDRIVSLAHVPHPSCTYVAVLL